MEAIRATVGLLTVLVVLPIWFYLLYQILEAVNATELMWFLYWIYLPVNLLAAAISRVFDEVYK